MLDLRFAVPVAAVLALGACADNDAQLTKSVHERLAEQSATDDQITVTTKRRVVVLEGVVSDLSELNRVELAARSVAGIRGVDNRLVVQSPVNVTGATSTKPGVSPAGPQAPPSPAAPSVRAP